MIAEKWEHPDILRTFRHINLFPGAPPPHEALTGWFKKDDKSIGKNPAN
jgi:hypothetical protein